jgi:dihydropteroate synthase
MHSARILTVHSVAEAVRELTALHIDLAAAHRMVPKMVHHSLLVEEISCNEGYILKQEMQALGGDALLAGKPDDFARTTGKVVLTGTKQQFRDLCSKLSLHPLPVHELSLTIERLLDFHRPSSMIWNIGSRTLAITNRPFIMGILNITPDSFSDGSLYFNTERAFERALEMEDEGADIIDIGAESTRPYALPVSETEELRRIVPVLEKLAGRLKIPVSIDTYKSSVAREALMCGVEIVNDISGFTFDSRMAEVVASAKAGVVLTHTKGKPTEMQENTSYFSIVPEIITILQQAIFTAVSSGIAAESIVIDPGIGFGKSVAGNLEILHRLEDFSVLGRPILVGTSRKSFIGSILNREVGNRIFGTAATNALALANGASIIRVHDVREMRDVADMTMAIIQGMAASG